MSQYVYSTASLSTLEKQVYYPSPQAICSRCGSIVRGHDDGIMLVEFKCHGIHPRTKLSCSHTWHANRAAFTDPHAYLAGN